MPASGKDRGSVFSWIFFPVASFAVVYSVLNWVVLPAIRKPVESAPAAVSGVPLPPSVVATPSAAPRVEPPRIESLPLPEGIEVEKGSGLLEVEIPGPDVLYVDGTFVGRGPTRRVPLPPGPHSLGIGEVLNRETVAVEITSGSRTRVSRSSAR
jgi:hypothetical protein